MSSIRMNNFENIIHCVLKQREIENYELEIEGKTAAADGYLGDVIFFRIIKHDGEKLHFVFKTAKTNEKLREKLSAAKAYNREISMYSIVFPLLESFLQQKKLHLFLDFVPKAWFTSSVSHQETVILENLKYRNYELWDRKKPMDLMHIKKVLKTYGKWHGLSMAFKDQNPETFNKVFGGWSDVRALLLKELGCVESYKMEFEKALRRMSVCGRTDLINLYRKIQDQIDYVVLRKGEKEDFLCITHGDSWINNFMFQYATPGELKPKAVCFLDFQLSMTDSPVVDISNFFYNVADKTSYENFELLLRTYYDSLAYTIKSLGSNPEKIFTMTDLKRHWKKYGLYGVITSLIHMKLQLCEPNEAPDLNKLMENGENLAGSFGFQIRNAKIFEERIQDIFVHYGEFLKYEIE